jgi:hypothetical protein
MKWWEVILYLFATTIIILILIVFYNKNEKARADEKIEADKKKRMLDLQTLHQLKEMGLA